MKKIEKMSQMKKLIVAALCMTCMVFIVYGEKQERKLPAFTEISLRVPAKLYLTQGSDQKVVVDASSGDLEEIITEIRDRALVIRFPAQNYLWKPSSHDKITIWVTIPEISGLSLSGAGDIIAEKSVTSLIVDLNVSGSGSINIGNLVSDRVKSSISGSGDIILKGEKPASEFIGSIAGSGNIKAGDFEAGEVKISIAGSGNCTIRSNGKIKARIAGSGNIYYAGNPDIDSSIAGSGVVSEVR